MIGASRSFSKKAGYFDVNPEAIYWRFLCNLLRKRSIKYVVTLSTLDLLTCTNSGIEGHCGEQTLATRRYPVDVT